MELKNIVDYREGEKVTKVLLDSPNHGALICMAFDKGLELPVHSTDSNVIVQILDGECEFTVEGRPCVLKEGDFLTLAPNTKHSLKAIQRFKILLTKINA